MKNRVHYGEFTLDYWLEQLISGGIAVSYTHLAGGFRANHPRRRLRYFPEKPCTAGARTFIRLWNEIPGSAS